MRKPLLSDDILERAKKERNLDSSNGYYSKPKKAPKKKQVSHRVVENVTSKTNRDKHVYKSRRIENEKRDEFQKKLNTILLILIILVAVLFYAIFKL